MKVLFFDTETYADPPKYPTALYGRIRLLQLKWIDDDKVYIFDTKQDPNAIEKATKMIQEADELVIHNAFYDLNLDELIGLEFKGTLFDTRLACIYDRPCAEKYDLNSCLKRYSIGYKEELGASDWSGDLTEDQLEYAKQDVVLLEKLYNIVKDVKKIPAFRLDMKNYKYAVKYSHNGFPVRHDRRLMFIDKYKKIEEELKSKLPEDLNVNSPKQVTAYLGVPKSDKATLVDLATEDAKTILALRDVQKKLSTLTKKFNFDRVKSLFKPAQAKSGRWTASARTKKEPQYQNLQQIDRDLKTVFGFEDDNDLYVVDADYSSLELYTAAVVFNSSTMMELLIQGKDLHKYTASNAFNKPEDDVTKDERQVGKGCIAEYELVYTVSGAKPIKDIEVGDLVYCLDSKGSVSVKPVLAKKYMGYKKVVKLDWMSGNNHKKGSLVCTPDHPIRLKSGSYLRADKTLGKSLGFMSIRENKNHRVTSISDAGYAHVYDLEVADHHNFIVNDICVHNCNFGTLYGAGVEVVQIFIQTYTGKKFPLQEVEMFRNAWLNTYKDIKAYHKRMGERIQGKKVLMVKTPLGRPICAKSYTEAINTPAQGFGAECTKIALYLLHKRLPDVKVINTVHDSITLEVKGFENAKNAAWVLKGCLDDSFEIAKQYIKHGNPLLKKLTMNNTATVHKIYEGDVLYSTDQDDFLD